MCDWRGVSFVYGMSKTKKQSRTAEYYSVIRLLCARNRTRTCTTGKGQGIFLPATVFTAPVFTKQPDLESGLSLRHASWPETSGAACQVSTPFLHFWENLARDCHLKGFPDVKRFYIPDFSGCTQICLSPSCLPFHHPGNWGKVRNLTTIKKALP